MKSHLEKAAYQTSKTVHKYTICLDMIGSRQLKHILFEVIEAKTNNNHQSGTFFKPCGINLYILHEQLSIYLYQSTRAKYTTKQSNRPLFRFT